MRNAPVLLRVAVLESVMVPMNAPLLAQSPRTTAVSVMENAQAICTFANRGTSLTVTCPSTLPAEKRLGFAAAIANADAILSGGERRISFCIQGQGEFASADPRFGIRATPQPRGPQPRPRPTQSRKIQEGTPANSVVAWRGEARQGKASATRQVGTDGNGLLVEWRYSDVTYVMARRVKDGVEVYRVIHIDRHE